MTCPPFFFFNDILIKQNMDNFGKFAEKMAADGCGPAAIAAFKHNFEALISGGGGPLP
jgi:hypothetical protein